MASLSLSKMSMFRKLKEKKKKSKKYLTTEVLHMKFLPLLIAIPAYVHAYVCLDSLCQFDEYVVSQNNKHGIYSSLGLRKHKRRKFLLSYFRIIHSSLPLLFMENLPENTHTRCLRQPSEQLLIDLSIKIRLAQVFQFGNCMSAFQQNKSLPYFFFFFFSCFKNNFVPKY